MKTKKPVPYWIEEGFDSEEELFFDAWCREAKEHGYIQSYEYHPETLKICQKVSLKSINYKNISVRPLNFEVDFIIILNEEQFSVWREICINEGIPMVDRNGYSPYYSRTLHSLDIDIKGTFTRRDSESSKFSVMQRIILKVFGVYINKVVPLDTTGKKFKPGFFRKTWVPERAYFTRVKKGVSKKWVGARRISEFAKIYPIGEKI